MLIKIDEDLYLNLDHITMVERDREGVVIRFHNAPSEALASGPRAQRVIDVLDARRRWLMRLDRWLRRVLGVPS